MNTRQKYSLALLLCAAPITSLAVTANLQDEIVVTASRYAQPVSQTVTHSTLITRQEIEDSRLTDVPSILKTLAGLEYYQSGGVGQQGSLFMRGSNSGHVLVLIDGVRIGSATTGATQMDQLMLDQVDHIEVVRGNVSSLYGSDAIGGVVQIFTRRGKGQPGFEAGTDVGTHNSLRLRAGFEGGVGDTVYDVQVSRYRTDGISAVNPEIAPTVNPDRDGYDNGSLSANLQHALNDRHLLSATYFDSHGEAQTDNTFGLATDVNSTRSRVRLWSLTSENSFSDAWQSKLQWSDGEDDMRNFMNGAPDDIFGALFRTDNRQLIWQNDVTLNARQKLTMGLERLVQQVSSSTAYAENRRQVNSMFLGLGTASDGYNWQLNLRQDRYSDFGVANTGMFGYGHALDPDWRLTASIGTAFKAPTINDLYYPYADYGGGYSYRGNAALQPERSRNIELGAQYTTARQSLSLTYFDNRIRDLIASNGLSANTMINLQSARCNGLELSYMGRFEDVELDAELTAQDPRDDSTGLLLLRRARTFGTLAAKRQAGSWHFAADMHFSGPRDDIDINTFARTTLAGYSVFNLTARRALDPHVDFSLRLDNLFGRDYMLAHGYNTTGRTLFAGIDYRR